MTGYVINNIRVTYGKRDARMWFGGFDADFRHLDDDAWVNLTTIGEFLEINDKPLPPDLAQWLLLAIRAGEPNRDTGEFLRRLGLKAGRGNPNGAPVKVQLEWGERVWRYENVSRVDDKGNELPLMEREEALETVLEEIAEHPDFRDERVSRASLQNWRNAYEKHWDEAHAK